MNHNSYWHSRLMTEKVCDDGEIIVYAERNAGVIAMAEGGAIVRLGECDAGWCQISGAGAKGWVEKAAIWGVDPDEIRD